MFEFTEQALAELYRLNHQHEKALTIYVEV